MEVLYKEKEKWQVSIGIGNRRTNNAEKGAGMAGQGRKL